jgi:hypothetical protein
MIRAGRKERKTLEVVLIGEGETENRSDTRVSIQSPLADPPKESHLHMETGAFVSRVKGAKVYIRVFPHLSVYIKLCCVFITDFTGLVDTI